MSAERTAAIRDGVGQCLDELGLSGELGEIIAAFSFSPFACEAPRIVGYQVPHLLPKVRTSI